MMNQSTISIPDWTDDGVIPPFWGELDSPDSIPSPYHAPLAELVSRFGNSEERRELLLGLLGYRSVLHNAGITRGFQWIDGSFVEDIENGERNRPPDDIDIVTFFYIPDGHTQTSFIEAFPHLFDQDTDDSMKCVFSVDAHIYPLNHTDPETLIRRSAYWYGVWSHRREDTLWKGFVQVDLDDSEDERAQVTLDRISGEEGGQ